MSTVGSGTSKSDEGSPVEVANRLGQLVSGRYRIEKLLGEGGMGAVYLAEHTHMRKRVALKLLHPEMSENPEVLARFEREARAAARIEHPNVAAATDFGRTEDGAFFLVLEYIEGESLRSVLARGPIAPARALRIARQMASALARAHEAGIVHRDLKPENVMLVHRGDEPDFVKVLDFGIAKEQAPELREGAAAQPLTRLGTILGTPEYMAPEQALGEPVTPQSDLYAMGVMLYEMLTGLHPFDAPDRMAVLSFHIVAPVPLMRDRAPALDVPPTAEAITRKLLEKDAKARPSSARALVGELDVALAGLGEVAPTSMEALPAAPSERSLRVSVTGPVSARVVADPDASAQAATGAWNAADSFAHTSLGAPAAPRPSAAPLGAGPLALFLSWPKPVRIALVAAPLVGFLLVLVAVLALRGGKADGPGAPGASEGPGEPSGKAAAKPPRVPEEALRAAGRDAAALENLAKEFPTDPAVPRALALTHHAQGRAAEALEATRKAIELAKGSANVVDAELVQVVTDLAVKGKGDDDDAAWAILEGPLGARGVDALVELSALSTGPRAAAVRSRAKASLAKPEVRANATPATAVLLDFRGAKDCAKKKELLARARTDGDARLLASLRSMRSPRGCGFAGLRDCWPCLRDGTALDDAVTEIEKRAPAPAGSEAPRR